MDLVDNAGRCCNKIQIIFSLKAFLYNFKVKKPQKSASESETECDRSLRLKLKCGIVELKFFKRVSQIRVLCAVRRIKSAVYHRIYLFVSGQGLCARILCIRDRITHMGILYIFQARSNVAYHSGAQLITGDKLSRPEGSHFHNFRFCTGSHHKHRGSFSDSSFLNAAEYNNAFVRIIFRVKDQSFQRRIGISFRSRDL